MRRNDRPVRAHFYTVFGKQYCALCEADMKIRIFISLHTAYDKGFAPSLFYSYPKEAIPARSNIPGRNCKDKECDHQRITEKGGIVNEAFDL